MHAFTRHQNCCHPRARVQRPGAAGGDNVTVPAFQPLRSRNQPGVRLPTQDITATVAEAWLVDGDRAQRRAALRYLRRHQKQTSPQEAQLCRLMK